MANLVDIGASDQLSTFGDLDVGTDTQVDSQSTADASTFSAAGGENASATTTVNAMQTVNVDPGAQLFGFGTVYLTPGTDALNGASSFIGTATANSNAEAITVGIATASANTSISSGTTLDIKPGNEYRTAPQIVAGQVVNIGGYPGTLAPSNSSQANTSILGIPGAISSSGGNQPVGTSTSSVTQDGTITAGLYNQLSINVQPGAQNGTQVTVNNGSPVDIPATDRGTNWSFPTVSPGTASQPAYLGFTVDNQSGLDVPSFISQYFSDPSSPDSSVQEQQLDETTTSAKSPVDALFFNSPLWVSGGNVIVTAGTSFTGNGTITANVGQISITNSSPDYLIFQIPDSQSDQVVPGSLTVNDLPGSGEVEFTGSITAAPSGMHVVQGGQSSITVDTSYDQTVGDEGFGPAIFLMNPVSNGLGGVTIDDVKGSLGQAASISADSLTLDVYGSLDVNVAGTEFLGADPAAAFTNQVGDPGLSGYPMIFPGGSPDDPTSNDAYAYQAVAFAANAENPVARADAVAASSDPAQQAYDFTQSLIGQTNKSYPDGSFPDNISFSYVGDQSPFIRTSDPEADFSEESQAQYFSALLQPGSDAAYQIHGDSSDTSEGWFPIIPIEPIQYSLPSDVAPVAGPFVPEAPIYPSASAYDIGSGLIDINAGTIDLDAQITAGRTNDWSVTLPAGLTGANGETIDQFRSSWRFSLTGSPILTLDVPPAPDGVSTIAATYDAITNQITVQPVSAFSGGADVVIHGTVINTMPSVDSSGEPSSLASFINVISGVGNITVNNQTGIPLVLQNLDAGSSAPSQVDIINTDPNLTVQNRAAQPQTLYIFTPGQGTKTYTGPANANTSTLAGFTLGGQTAVNAAGTSSVSYSPVTGDRWQWQLVAFLNQTLAVHGDDQGNGGQDYTASQWTWGAPPDATSLQNPSDVYWYYAIPGSSLQTVPGTVLQSPQLQSFNDPIGQVVPETNLEGDYFSETISSPSLEEVPNPGAPWTFTYADTVDADGTYHNQDYGFPNVTNPPTDDPNDNNESESFWTYVYPLNLMLELTASVRADYPVAIEFSGASTGNVTITSDAPVFLDGQIVNPNGTTTITLTADNQTPKLSALNIMSAPGASISTSKLVLSAPGRIGSPSNPISTAAAVVSNVQSGPGSSGVYLDLLAAAVIGTVTAGNAQGGFGNVVMTAQGNLTPLFTVSPNTAETDASDIIGDNITLDGIATVGSATAPLVLDANPIILPSGATSGGVVNVQGGALVNIEQSAGNLLVGKIASLASDVTVDVPDGRILNASEETIPGALDTNEFNQANALLHLTDPSSVNQTIQANYPLQVDAAYQGYWTILSYATISSGQAALSPAGKAYYLAPWKLYDASNSSTENEDAYVTGLYQEWTTLFNQAFGGPDWGLLLEFQSYDPTFRYTLTNQTIITSLTAAPWNLTELTHPFDSAALGATSPAAPAGSPSPEIIGRNVTLESGAGVGRLEPSVVITPAELSEFYSGSLPAAQTQTLEQALVSSTTAGDLTFYVPNAEGINLPVTFNGAIPSGWTELVATVSEPVFISAPAGALNLDVQGPVFVQATTSAGNSQGNLMVGDVSVTGSAHLSAPGNITSSTTGTPALSVSGDLYLTAGGNVGASATKPLTIAGGGKLTTTAGGAIYLEQTSGQLLINQVVAASAVSIQSADAIVVAANANPIAGTNVTLQSIDQGIGTVGQPVPLSVSGSLTATGAGDLFLSANSDGTALDIAKLNSTEGNVNLTTAGNVTLSHVTASSGTATIKAGAILSGDSGLTRDIQAQSAVLAATSATGSIGAAVKPLEIQVTTISANAQGGVWIDQPLGNLELESVISHTSVSLTADGSLLQGPNVAPVQSQAPDITLLSQTGSIGTSTTNLVIRSGAFGSGSLTASARSGIDVAQTQGSLTVHSATTSKGSIVFDVPGDATAGDNFALTTGGTLSAPAGAIILNVGGNVTIPSGTKVSGKSSVHITGDFQNLSGSDDSVLVIDSPIESPSVLIKGGSQGEVVNLERVAVHSKATIDLNSGRNNTVNIGSLEPSTGGVLSGIAGTIEVVGNPARGNLSTSMTRVPKTARTGVLTQEYTHRAGSGHRRHPLQRHEGAEHRAR